MTNTAESSELKSITPQNQSENWVDIVATDTRAISTFGLIAFGIFISTFGLWAVLFPLSSAVVAKGFVIPIGKSKRVQHPTGGAVIQIHAIDGQAIKVGDLIVTLDPIVDQSELDNLQSRYVLLNAMEARLVAQNKGKVTIQFPDSFYAVTDKAIAGEPKHLLNFRYDQLMADQQRELDAKRQLMTKELSELNQQISSFRGQLISLSSQKKNIVKQKENIYNRLMRIEPLVEKDYFPRNEADELKLQYLEVSADLDSVTSQITRLKFSINETKDRKATTIASRRSTISSELSEIRGEKDTVNNQITAAVSTLEKRDIKASAAGILTKSSVHTIGGVVGPGEIIAEIVPVGGYKVEARIALKDIDYVHPGQTARVVITAFNRKKNDPIPATVDYVAADSEIDNNTGEQFFVVRLVLEELPEVANQLNNLRAGMESEVYIITGERTFLNYIMKPLTDGFRRAFQEN
ncbi:MAG: HlyD family type I secretion periplasmic adaptor subunit [Methylococcaceae bacterium]